MNRDTLLEDLFNDTQSLRRVWKQYFYKVLGDESLSPAQMGILFYINEHQPVTGKKVAKILQISPSAVTQLIDGLDQLNWITREHDEADRRIMHIRLSDAGRAKVDQLEQRRKEFFMDITETLCGDEIVSMITIQKKMMAQIEKKLKETI